MITKNKEKLDYTLTYNGITGTVKAETLTHAIRLIIDGWVAENFSHIRVLGDGIRIEICDKNENLLAYAFYNS